ncbi:hypothetical protein BEP19_00460 [Ammoniphilus oxalaticus]|uniref:DUF975 domain-containing protein n=1 Tax=Ammoniphilus oxalaticus TaxID=66863 RepID=A0A419SRD5_9BACL|nr:DUF975 family protein [Ammoniphilus oxalaticus]RKD27080.1 hypothetical protein BEP19_00460 [Ammoniphilus oxalaticus]
MNLRISEIKSESKSSLKGNWGLVVLLTFILFLLNFVIPTIIEVFMSGGVIEWLDQEERSIGVDVVSIIISIALIPFDIGVSWFFLSLIRKKDPRISDVFSIYKDGKTSFKMIGASILQVIYLFLWSLLLIVPGIIKGLAYSQTFFILRDHPDYKVTEAITESRKMMNGYKWKYFLLWLSFVGWGILCLFTLGIGFLWLIPYISASVAIFYNQIASNWDNDIGDNETNY